MSHIILCYWNSHPEEEGFREKPIRKCCNTCEDRLEKLELEESPWNDLCLIRQEDHSGQEAVITYHYNFFPEMCKGPL